jgi:hypothetical protein
MLLIAAIGLSVFCSSGTQELRVPQSQLNFRSFVLSAYPELDGLGAEIEHRVNGAVVGIRVAVPDARIVTGRVPVLTARVELTAQNEVKSFEARGQFLSDAENDALARDVRQAVAAGTDTLEAIARRAPRFGPSERVALITRIERINLAARLGATQIVSVSAVTTPVDTRYGFLWLVELDGVRSGESVKHYLLTFEPFQGRLISLREQ